uniref:Erythropoietin receptor n=1 Tax=Neogobius melanostomus TaxID=47308 RepID=A0A8C6TKD1_9GOBI
MTCDYLRRLLAVHLIVLCTAGVAVVRGARDFEKKVSMMLHEVSENPKCFAEGRKDLTCFWEDEERTSSVDQYSFIYTYKNERSSKCPLKAFHLTSGKKLYVCRLNQTQMFVQMDIQVKREGRPIHNRSLQIELTFLLDPPTNLTVRNAAQPGQVNVSWIPPPLKYMDDSMMYEIIFSPVDSLIKHEVEVARATSELVLRGLQPATKYKVQVRVKLDGISYSGYWSAWSDPVFIDTPPAVLDPLIISLSVIISCIFLVLSLTMLASHRRYLIKKVWPIIPTPESKFQGLFNIYGGDFKEWMGHTSGDLWQSPNLFYAEESPSSLEVLSELPVNPLLQVPPLPPKGLRMTQGKVSQDVKTNVDMGLSLERGDQSEDWTTKSHDHWLMERLQEIQQQPIPYSQESQDTYVSLSHNTNSEGKQQDAIPEENVPLEVLFTSRKTSESHSDLGSGSGQLSSQSSFEYSNQDWAPKPPAYTYMAVADSGVSMDYSPMSRSEDRVPVFTHEYKNDMFLRRAFLTRQQHIQDNY